MDDTEVSLLYFTFCTNIVSRDCMFSEVHLSEVQYLALVTHPPQMFVFCKRNGNRVRLNCWVCPPTLLVRSINVASSLN
jgi:hypothetical protein